MVPMDAGDWPRSRAVGARYRTIQLDCEFCLGTTPMDQQVSAGLRKWHEARIALATLFQGDDRRQLQPKGARCQRAGHKEAGHKASRDVTAAILTSQFFRAPLPSAPVILRPVCNWQMQLKTGGDKIDFGRAIRWSVATHLMAGDLCGAAALFGNCKVQLCVTDIWPDEGAHLFADSVAARGIGSAALTDDLERAVCRH